MQDHDERKRPLAIRRCTDDIPAADRTCLRSHSEGLHSLVDEDRFHRVTAARIKVNRNGRDRSSGARHHGG
jgi:phosphatidylserine/phosphatidylglycerophosphate/cardiolipin synthase-like enzyme